MERSCKVCGWVTEGSERECLECGAPLPELEELDEKADVSEEISENPPEEPPKKKKRKWPWVLVSGVVVLLVLVGLWAAKGQSKGGNQAVAVTYRGEKAQQYTAVMTDRGIYRLPASEFSWMNCDENGQVWIFRGNTWAADNSTRWLGNSWLYNHGDLQTVSWGPAAVSWDGSAIYYVNLDGTEQVLYHQDVKSGKSSEITRADSFSNLVVPSNGKAVCFQVEGRWYHWMEPYGVEELGEWSFANPGGSDAGAICVSNYTKAEGSQTYLIWRDETGKLGEPEPITTLHYTSKDLSQVICKVEGKGYALITRQGEELIFPGTGDYSEDPGELLQMLDLTGDQTTLTDWFYRYQGKLFYLDDQGKPEEIVQFASEDWSYMWITENHDKLFYLTGGALYVVENPKKSERQVKWLADAGAISVWFSPNMKEIYLSTYVNSELCYLSQDGELVTVAENCKWAAPLDDGSCYFTTWEGKLYFTDRGEAPEELELQGDGYLQQWKDSVLYYTEEERSLQAWKLEKGGAATPLEDLEIPKEEEKPAPFNPFAGLFAKEERRFPQLAEGWLHYNYFDHWVASEQGVYPLGDEGLLISASDDFSSMVVTQGGQLFLLTGDGATPLEGDLGWLSGDGKVVFLLDYDAEEQTLSRMELGKSVKTAVDTGVFEASQPVIAYDGSAIAYSKQVTGRWQTWQWTIRQAARDAGLGQLQDPVSLGREGLTRTIREESVIHGYDSTLITNFKLQFTETGAEVDLGSASYETIQNRDENQVIYHTEEGWFYADAGQEPFDLGISGDDFYPVGGKVPLLLNVPSMNGGRGELDRLTNWIYRSGDKLYYLSDALEVKELATGVSWAEIDDFGKKLVYWNKTENTVYVMKNPLRDSRKLSKLDISAEITAVAASKDLETIYYADRQGNWFRDVADNENDELVAYVEEGEGVSIYPLTGGAVWYLRTGQEKCALFFEKPGDLEEQKLEFASDAQVEIDVLPQGNQAILTVYGSGGEDKGTCYVLDENGEVLEKIALKWEGTTWS